jgi:hypothetical protein
MTHSPANGPVRSRKGADFQQIADNQRNKWGREAALIPGQVRLPQVQGDEGGPAPCSLPLSCILHNPAAFSEHPLWGTGPTHHMGTAMCLPDPAEEELGLTALQGPEQRCV